MSFVEISGYVAAILVFLTFYMRTMINLRLVGIASNVAFIVYGLLNGLIPVLVLHLTLLPLNIVRFVQLRRMTNEIKTVLTDDLSLDSLLPYMTARKLRAGDVLFHKGDEADELFYVANGRIRLVELDVDVSDGALLGEIGLFSPSLSRTATARSEEDGTVLSISHDRIYQLFFQEPRFALFIVRLITGRLIENMEQMAQRSGAPGAPSERAAQETKRASQARSVAEKLRWRRRLTVGTTAALLVITLVGFGLSLRPLTFHDATITTWIQATTAPISGDFVDNTVAVGDKVPENGVIGLIRNRHLDNSAPLNAQAEERKLRRVVENLEDYLDQLTEKAGEWEARFEGYAEAFINQIQSDLERQERELELVDQNIELVRHKVSRMERLRESDTVAVSAAEAAERELIELQRQRNLHLRAESDLTIRLDSARRGLFLAADGKEADWAYRERNQLDLELEKTRRELRDNQAALERAVEKAQVLQAAWEARSMATVSGPAGLTVWSMPATPGSTVRVGEPIALLVDCDLELVDLRLPDSEIILIDKTMPAEVRLEGSAKVTRGHVVQIRGPASVLGQNDLAADALGTETNNWGQVLIQLDRRTSGEQPSASECRIGRNAYVDFPEVSTWSLILSWLYTRPY